MNSTYAQKSSTVQKAADSNAASVLDSSSQSESLQRKADMANNAAQRAEVPRPNNTGMPDNLKSGIESLSGFSMDDVRVHYNSSKPATVQALAYTQGTDIHVAPGQEKHLPHEAWHVAQQMAGRVSPTTNINGMPVNDNAALEHEADVMGEKAVQCKDYRDVPYLTKINQGEIVQREPHVKFFEESHKETVDGIEKDVGDVVRKIGVDYERCRNLHIAFETFGDKAEQLKDLYNNVIKKFKGKATVVIGINVEASLNKHVSGANGFYATPEAYRDKVGSKKDGENLYEINRIPDRLLAQVHSLKQIDPNNNHKIIICPFIYDGRYRQGGDYNMPYCEIRGKLMEMAVSEAQPAGSAKLYRWIDRDCRDDGTIEFFNNKVNSEIESFGDDVYSAAYDWRIEENGDFLRLEDKSKNCIRLMVDLINKYEHKARSLFFKIREKQNLTRRMNCDVCGYYLPETALYMSSGVHERAIAKLKKIGENQSGESRHATFGTNSVLHFISKYRCSKPVKNIVQSKSYLYVIEEILPPKVEECPSEEDFFGRMKKLRQTVFDETSWKFSDKDAEQEWITATKKMLKDMYDEYCQDVLPREMKKKVKRGGKK